MKKKKCCSILIKDAETIIGIRGDKADVVNVVVPRGIEGIGNFVFAGCTELTSITFPDTLKSISDRAFGWCTGLTSIIFPVSLKSIGEYAFAKCTGLTSVVFPPSGSLESIGGVAFGGCSGLTSVTLPKMLTSVGEGVFNSCTGLTSISFPDSLKNVSGKVFCGGCTSLTSAVFQPPVGRGVFIAWAVGSMCNRANWYHTSLRHLSGVLHLVTVLALERRDVATLSPDMGVFHLCPNLRLNK